MRQKIKVGVVGAGGRVGLELLGLIKNSPDLEATLGIGRKAQGFDINSLEFPTIENHNVNVVIDFSTPELIEKTLAFCISHQIPLVCGTTGLSAEHFNQLEKAGNLIPLLWSPNMSLGVAVLKKALRAFKTISHYDFQIEEWHHRNKKDSPSGTAVMIKKELENIIEKPTPPAMVMRAGGIYGVHKVYAVSDEEIIQFEHTAINRTVFARGALTGARWLLNQKNGFYSIDNVIV